MDIQMLSIKTHLSENGGGLSFVEAERDIPFPVKRIYYVHGEKKGAHRGFHAHIALRQVLICPYGSIKILLDDGNEREEVLLDSPQTALVLPPHYWHEMIWMKDNSVLCVLASDYYDENDYIRDYNDFLNSVKH